jgi:hypothetical protein
MKSVYLILFAMFFFPVVLYSGQITSYERGQLAGSLGFGAMVIDAFYETCYANGMRTDNNLNGINKLLKEKWSIGYLEIIAEQEKKTGRNFRQEAHDIVNTAIEKSGGCESPGMEQWFRYIEKMHEDNLNIFHSVQ